MAVSPAARSYPYRSARQPRVHGSLYSLCYSARVTQRGRSSWRRDRRQPRPVRPRQCCGGQLFQFRGQAGAPDTRRTRRNILERWRVEHGEKRVALLAREHIARMVAAKAATPSATRPVCRAASALTGSAKPRVGASPKPVARRTSLPRSAGTSACEKCSGTPQRQIRCGWRRRRSTRWSPRSQRAKSEGLG